MQRDSSSPSGDHPDEDDLPDLPRATELLMKLKKRQSRVSWRMLIPCLGFLGMAVFHIIVDGEKAMTGVAIWFGVAAVTLVGERWDQQKKHDQLVIDLLGELVAENNRLRRLVPESPKTVN